MFWRFFGKNIDVDVFDDVPQNAKHRVNDASNDVNRPPLLVEAGGLRNLNLRIWNLDWWIGGLVDGIRRTFSPHSFPFATILCPMSTIWTINHKIVILHFLNLVIEHLAKERVFFQRQV